MKRIAVYLVFVIVLGMFAGCKTQQADAYYKDICIQWLDDTYEPKAEMDNDWLQQKSLAAAERHDLTTVGGLSAYLDNIVPTLERYIAQGETLTAICHYSNGVWMLRFDFQPKENERMRMDSNTTLFYVSESGGEMLYYEHVLD